MQAALFALTLAMCLVLTACAPRLPSETVPAGEEEPGLPAEATPTGEEAQQADQASGGDTTAESPNEGEEPVVALDWDTVLSDLPEPGFGDEFDAYCGAVARALQRKYEGDNHVSLMCIYVRNPGDPEEWDPGDAFRYQWGWSRAPLPYPGNEDPLRLDLAVKIGFGVTPASTERAVYALA